MSNRSHAPAKAGQWSFLTEVKDRGILTVAAGYLGASWLVIEVGHTLFAIFYLPHLPLQVVASLLVLGFPAALLLAWYFRPVGMASPVHGQHGTHTGAAHHVPTIAAIVVVLLAVTAAIGHRVVSIGSESPPAPREVDRVSASETSPHVALTAASTASPNEPKFSPPDHSIAVLPFVNMSGDPSQDYFSDGLSEELLNSLSRINALHVAARTSSFSFKGRNVDIPTIARKLNVGAVLDGSVRREGNRVRITAQLVNAVTNYQLWSQSYDRDLSGILALQSDIAQAVTSALAVTLLGDAAKTLELGGTANPQAFDAYLRGVKLSEGGDEAAVRAELAAADEAIRLDPNYVLAFVLRARALAIIAEEFTGDPAMIRTTFAQARGAAERGIALASDLGEVHAQLANILEVGFFDFAGASTEYDRALAIAPGSAEVQRLYTRFASRMGHAAVALVSARRVVALDSLNPKAYRAAGLGFFYSRQYQDTITSLQRAITLRGRSGDEAGFIGFADIALGRPEPARAVCAEAADHSSLAQVCLAIAYHFLGRQAEADAKLAQLRGKLGDAAAFQYAEINAQWGRSTEALKWLDTANRLRDPGLVNLKTDPLLDPIRDEPQFKQIERQLKFPP